MSGTIHKRGGFSNVVEALDEYQKDGITTYVMVIFPAKLTHSVPIIMWVIKWVALAFCRFFCVAFFRIYKFFQEGIAEG